MMEFGKTLRAAREAKGYTVSQLAEMTRLMSSVVEGIENEDFSMIAAPIYGRGFVKLYCEAVGLDPKPFVEEFMEIFNGNRELGIKERPVRTCAPAQEEVPREDEPEIREPLAAVPPPPHEDLFERSASRFAPAPAVSPAPAAPPPPEPSPLAEEFAHAQRDEVSSAKLSRYASPVREYRPRFPVSLPPNIWRMALLGGVVAALVWLVCLGVKTLYTATSAPAEEAVPAARPASAAQPGPAAGGRPAPAAPAARKGIEVPALYID